MSGRASGAPGRAWRPRLRAPGAPAIRILVAAAVLAAASFGFLAAGATADLVGRVVASWQLFPVAAAVGGAVTAANGAIAVGAGFAAGASLTAGLILLALLLLSALLGRWYCAALCPLGTLQDIGSWLGRRSRRYRKPVNAVRAVAALGVLVLVLLGAMSVASWLDPWSIFSRFFSYDLQSLARLAVRADVPGIGPWTLIPAAAAMTAVIIMAILNGRWFCGTLCPVGSLLGLLNRAAPFRLRMESSTCVSCGRCAAVCPASCVDPSSRRIDESRCIYCLSCIKACPTRALHYGRPRPTPSPASSPAVATPPLEPAPALGPVMSRLGFLAALAGGAAALALAALPGRSLTARFSPALTATTPPGARSLSHFLDTCTACGLCTARCPSRVLQPSLGQLGPRGLLVPRLDYSVSYCQYECTICLEICPSGALARMPLDRKKLTKIGDATLVRDRCIVFTKKTRCGACAERCPTGAVRMIEVPSGIPEPAFTSSICIGCGACHYACPVRPERAITVAGLAVHGTAVKPLEGPSTTPSEGGKPPGSGSSDFPF